MNTHIPIIMFCLVSSIFAQNKIYHLDPVARMTFPNVVYSVGDTAGGSDCWGYVLRDEQPVGNEATRLSRLSVALDDMETRDASLDNAFVDAAVTYIHGYEQNKVFKNAEKDLKQMVRIIIMQPLSKVLRSILTMKSLAQVV